jgi:chemotaxis protein MotA
MIDRLRALNLDKGSLAVLPLGIAVVLGAQLLEGGTIRSLLQGPAALIVFGGTLAALLISYSPADVRRACLAAARTFARTNDDPAAMTSKLVGYAMRAQKRGLLTLEDEIETTADPFLRAGLSLVVDGASMSHLKDVLAAGRLAAEADEDAPVRVFEAAAGYAPTLGILGAVLGLIQVMDHLNQPGALGSGIAVAFVSTVYGVGAANLLFLPMAARLRERAEAAARRRDLMTEGLFALQQRMHPRLMIERLRGFSDGVPRLEEIAARMAPVKPAAQVPA